MAFGFQASSTENIFLNPANKKTDQETLIFRLALVKLLMPLNMQSMLFLIPQQYLLISLPLYRILMEVLFKFQKYMSYLLGFVTVSKSVGNTAHTLAYLFNSASMQHHEVWALQFCFTILGILSLLVKLAFMAALIILWLRLSNNLFFACPSLQPL